MTRIDFYRYAEDKQRLACRLAAKAYAKPSKLVVYSPDAKVLADFDRNLWTFQATGFVPHCFADSPLAAETPASCSIIGRIGVKAKRPMPIATASAASPESAMRMAQV